MEKISVIVSTYNRPDALKLVLQALSEQTLTNFEVLIADDGSTSSTAEMIKTIQDGLNYKIQHLWQEDNGFRAASARNMAVSACSGDYLVFLDGDCIPQNDFIENHYKLAEKNCFVAGNRILLSEKFTARISSPVWNWTLAQWIIAYIKRDINRLLPLIRLPMSLFKKRHKTKWQGAKTCNLAVWHSDFKKINGFDESYQGWGHEDADLVVRLLCSGVLRKEGRFAVPVLHLWHKESDRTNEQDNRQRLDNMIKKAFKNED